jgi:Transposase DDE domain
LFPAKETHERAKNMVITNILTTIFVEVDDFCKAFKEEIERNGISDGTTAGRDRATGLSDSELVTIVIAFHRSGFRTLKGFYEYLLQHYRPLFPSLLSYTRFVALQPRILGTLCMYVIRFRMGTCSGISFVDSTKIAVCGTKRISRNKVFKDVATIGKSSMGWFFGFKLHLVINDQGEIIAFTITTANTDDRKPLPTLTKNLIGKLFGDKGYISSELTQDLLKRGLQLFTTVKKNMKNKVMKVCDKLLLRKRSIIETVNDQLKNIAQIEHTRHRSQTNFLINLVAGIAAYSFQENKPKISDPTVSPSPICLA